MTYLEGREMAQGRRPQRPGPMRQMRQKPSVLSGLPAHRSREREHSFGHDPFMETWEVDLIADSSSWLRSMTSHYMMIM